MLSGNNDHFSNSDIILRTYVTPTYPYKKIRDTLLKNNGISWYLQQAIVAAEVIDIGISSYLGTTTSKI